jgi:hypothetical protein
VITVHNVSRHECGVSIPLNAGERLLSLLEDSSTDGRRRLLLEPYAYRWFRVE